MVYVSDIFLLLLEAKEYEMITIRRKNGVLWELMILVTVSGNILPSVLYKTIVLKKYASNI